MSDQKTPYFEMGLIDGMYDAVVDGKIVPNLPGRVVFIPKNYDKSNLPNYATGAFCIELGLKNAWQKNDAGGWDPLWTEA